MKKLFYIVGSILTIAWISLPAMAQTGSNQPASRLEEFTSVDGRPMERGAGAERLPQKSLSQTFTTKVNYKASEFEDEASCRIVGREEAKRNLVEKITDNVVEYYNKEVSVKYNLDPMVREETYCYLFNLVNFETIKDKWNNNELTLDMEATTNANDIIRQIIALYTNKPLIDHMIKNRKIANDAFDEIKKTKTSNNTKKQYANAVNQLHASDCFEKGLFSGFSGENQSAVDAFTKAIELNPTYAPAYNYRGLYLYSLKKDPQFAIVDFTKAIELDNTDTSFYESRGICYYKAKNSELAIKDFNRGLELNPSSASLLAARATVYEGTSQYQYALEDYSKAIEIDPEDLRPHYRMGLIYKQQKNYVQCIEAMGKAIAINDQFANAFYERALAYAYLKEDSNKEKVINDFKAAAKLGHTGAQEVLKSINVTW